MELLQQVNKLYEAKYDGPDYGVLDTRLIVTPEHLRQARGNKFQVIVKMAPEDFLKLTTSENNTPDYFQKQCKSVDDYNRWAQEGENIIMPGLWIKGDRVTSHEGRHRAAALMCAGEKEMAVALKLDPTEEHQEKYGYWEAPYQVKWEDYPNAIYGQYGKGIVLKSDMTPLIDGWDNLLQNINEARYSADPFQVADAYEEFSKNLNYGKLSPERGEKQIWVKDTGSNQAHKLAWMMMYVEGDTEKQALNLVKHYVSEANLPYTKIKSMGRIEGPFDPHEGSFFIIVEYKQ